MKNIRASFKEVNTLAELNNMELIKGEFLGNRAKPYFIYTLYLNDTKIFESESLKNIKNFINTLELEETNEIAREIINTLDFGEINVFESEEYNNLAIDSLDMIKSEVEVNSESGMIELCNGDYVQPYTTFRGEIIGILV